MLFVAIRRLLFKWVLKSHCYCLTCLYRKKNSFILKTGIRLPLPHFKRLKTPPTASFFRNIVKITSFCCFQTK